jgi:hypothetical protein
VNGEHPTPRICGTCGQPGAEYFHVRLNSPVHNADNCLRDLKGEDVRGHCLVQYVEEG